MDSDVWVTLIRHGEAFAEKHFPILKESVTIGREPDCDIIIQHESVSRHHAKIKLLSNTWILEDLNSTNGTFVEGNRISSSEISSKTKFALGRCLFEFFDQRGLGLKDVISPVSYSLYLSNRSSSVAGLLHGYYAIEIGVKIICSAMLNWIYAAGDESVVRSVFSVVSKGPISFGFWLQTMLAISKHIVLSKDDKTVPVAILKAARNIISLDGNPEDLFYLVEDIIRQRNTLAHGNIFDKKTIYLMQTNLIKFSGEFVLKFEDILNRPMVSHVNKVGEDSTSLEAIFHNGIIQFPQIRMLEKNISENGDWCSLILDDSTSVSVAPIIACVLIEGKHETLVNNLSNVHAKQHKCQRVFGVTNTPIIVKNPKVCWLNALQRK